MNLEVLKQLSKEAAREVIVAAFKLNEIDANEAFRLAIECDIELTIS